MSKRRMRLRGWYPQDKVRCLKEIQEFESEYPDVKSARSLAAVAPHAGWTYSGKLAGTVIRLLAGNHEEKIDTVIVLGGHMGPERVALLVQDDFWETPFGDLAIDKEFNKEIAADIPIIDEGPYADNTIEIQLPFVKHYFEDVKIVGLRPPLTNLAIDIGEKIFQVASDLGRNVCLIASNDMTHYGPNYGFMPKGTGEEALKWVKEVNDKGAIDLMVQCEPVKLIQQAAKNKSACSAAAPAAAISYVKKANITSGELIDYYTSYDISPNSSFVGYVGIVY